jgi:hypothetical protein
VATRSTSAKYCYTSPLKMRGNTPSDIETEDYEIDRDEIAAPDRLFARRPGAQIWFRRVGPRYAHRFGPRFKTVAALKTRLET